METMVDLVNALKALDFKPSEAKKLAQAAVGKLGASAPLGALVKEALQQKMHGPSKIVEVVSAEPEPAEEEEEEVEEAEFEEEPEEHVVRRRTSSRRRPCLVDPPRRRKARMHWGYAICVGWWLGILVLLLRFLVASVETVFEHEAKREADLPSLFGWW